MIEEILTGWSTSASGSEFAEEWDLTRCWSTSMTYYPTRLTLEALVEYEDRDDVVALVVEDAVGLYEAKCEAYVGGLDTAKEIERDVMLQILDQRWRDHLSDMDYLRDGIHLRQVAQQDPLTRLAARGLPDVRAHARRGQPRLRALHHPRRGRRRGRAEADGRGPRGRDDQRRRRSPRAAPSCRRHGSAPRRRSRSPKQGDKIGRNEPCWCGSGRKFKQCHGRP